MMSVDENGVMPGGYDSSTSLPPVMGATMEGKKPGGKDAQRMRQMRRRPTEGPRRQAFLKGLLNEDLQQLAQWHGSRPAHEQKRFIKSVDTLYKGFVNEPDMNKTAFGRPTKAQAVAAERARAQEVAAQKLAEQDPMQRPPTPTRGMGHSASAPLISNEVLDHRRRVGRDVEEFNGLDNWLEAGSVTTATTGTTATSRFTSFTQKTKTSSGGPSICSEPGTMTQLQYGRYHKRGIALNRWEWKAPDQHGAGNMKGGIPNFGFPDQERLATTFQDTFGTAAGHGENVTKAMYENVFSGNSQQFIDGYIEQADTEKKSKVMGMVRSLQYLRNARERERVSVQREEMNLAENSRLHKPKPQRPWFEPADSNMSQVPLGTLNQMSQKENPPPPPSAPPARPPAPPSPSISNLGSMPLSRLSTPMV